MFIKYLSFNDLLLFIKSNLKEESQITGKYGFNPIDKPLLPTYRAKYYISDFGIPFLLSTSRNLDTRIKIMSYLIS
jgi:hypothetical protein